MPLLQGDVVNRGAKRDRIAKAERRVIRAAFRWVNRNDDGRSATTHLLAGDNLELARSVAALETLRKQRR